jgi:hypothetical protein
MAWCKERALECVRRGDAATAIASTLSDLGKHPETAVSVYMATLIAPYGGTLEEVTRWIDGFN